MFDFQSKTLDFQNIKVSQLPFRKRVCMPPNVDENTEIKIAYARKSLNELLQSHLKQSKIDHLSNLTKEQKDGLKSLKEKNEKKRNRELHN